MRPGRHAAMASETQKWVFTVGVSLGCAIRRTASLLHALSWRVWSSSSEGPASLGCNKVPPICTPACQANLPAQLAHLGFSPSLLLTWMLARSQLYPPKNGHGMTRVKGVEFPVILINHHTPGWVWTPLQRTSTIASHL